MLDDVNQLMSSGYLPGLFSFEELRTILQSIQQVAKAAGVRGSEVDKTGERGCSEDTYAKRTMLESY